MTWSGTYTNEDVLSSPYQAKNGVRGYINMTALGDVVVDAPTSPEPDESFSLWVDNANRNLLTITASAIQDPGASVVASVTTRARHFVVGFTFDDDGSFWSLDKWMPFVTPMGIKEAAEWTPRTTNGPCTIIDSTPGVTVDRTAEGFYTINLNEALETADLVTFSPFVIGLAAENSPEVIQLSYGPMTIDVNTGFRNKNGQFTDSDLLQDPGNTMSVIIQKIP